MLTEVMRHYGLVRPPVDAEFFETDHYAQVSLDAKPVEMRKLLRDDLAPGSSQELLDQMRAAGPPA